MNSTLMLTLLQNRLMNHHLLVNQIMLRKVNHLIQCYYQELTLWKAVAR